MKRLCALILSVIVVLSLIGSVSAASSVPRPVIESTKSVVRILAEYPDGYATGSGFVIKSNKKQTLIATNYHVVEDDPYSISVWISDDETVSASILAYTDQKDMCILELDYPVSLKPIPFAKEGAEQGEAVYAVGFPGAADYLSDKDAHTSKEATITDGIVSAVRETSVSAHGAPIKILQINAAINSGNSGGPLFNAKGEVVGINTLGINDSQGIFGAIDVSELKIFMEDNDIAIPKARSVLIWWILGIVVVVVILTVVAIVAKRKITMKPRTKKKNKAIPLCEYMACHPNGIGANNAVAMLLPVAISLRDLHNDGRAHLEVSPNVIFIGERGAELNAATSTESNRYISGYAAPEIYRGVSAGNLSDIYSFCAILYFVATGQQPVDALARTGLEYEQDEESTIDAAFVEIVRSGTELDTATRISSIQEIIVKLSAFNTCPFVNDMYNVEPTLDANVPSKKKKIPIKAIALVSSVALVVALLGSYVGCYFWAKIEVNSGDFVTANKLLFLPFITEIYDHKLVEYVDAGMMMENREYEDAVEAFGDLGSYKDAEDLMNEASYRLAMQYADHNRFSKAVNLLEDLEEIDYSDAYDKIKEVQYRWAWSLIEKGDYIDAYEKLDEIWNYPAAKETKIALKDVIYEEGQALYSNQNYDSAKEHFEYISPYLDSEKYITLIDARGYKASIDPKGTAEKLAEIFCFEDAADLLLSNTDIACYFLLGNWRTSNGSYYFKMEKTSKTEHSFYSSYNLPWYGGTFCISDGIYIVSNDSYEEKPQFGFTLLTPNSMEVYCYKNGSTYTMYR